MRNPSRTLLEQMRITDVDIARRKELLGFGDEDVARLRRRRRQMEQKVDALVDRFYDVQTGIAEIALLIGDAGTLQRLRKAQRQYVLDLFSGVYDLEYVNNRLRIGMVHKRIGIEPRLYLAAIRTLKAMLVDELRAAIADRDERRAVVDALDKLFLFDVTLVFETYVRSLVSEIEIAKARSDEYARTLEQTVRERTRQLEEAARLDPLTGLRNSRYLNEFLIRALRAAERRDEPLAVAFFDIDDFKAFNDRQGHLWGDEVLRKVGEAVAAVSRAEDGCFRYGGDEFCVILPDCEEALAREIYADRLCGEVDRLAPGVTLSVGVAQTGPGEYADPGALLDEADRRMYAAKRKRKAGEAG